jgi:hypothetical protein
MTREGGHGVPFLSSLLAEMPVQMQHAPKSIFVFPFKSEGKRK